MNECEYRSCFSNTRQLLSFLILQKCVPLNSAKKGVFFSIHLWVLLLLLYIYFQLTLYNYFSFFISNLQFSSIIIIYIVGGENHSYKLTMINSHNFPSNSIIGRYRSMANSCYAIAGSYKKLVTFTLIFFITYGNYNQWKIWLPVIRNYYRF